MRADHGTVQESPSRQERIEARSAGRDLKNNHFERITIDFRLDVVFAAIDLEFRLIDGDFLSILTVGLKTVLQPMNHCLIVSDERSTNGSIRRYGRPAWYKNAVRTRRPVGVSSRKNT